MIDFKKLEGCVCLDTSGVNILFEYGISTDYTMKTVHWGEYYEEESEGEVVGITVQPTCKGRRLLPSMGS